MEKQPKTIENLNDNEIVSLENARFTDTLDPYYENTWTELESAISKSGLNSLETYGSIWNNQSLPQVFRDRALTRIANRDTRKEIHTDYIGTYYVSNIKHNQLTAAKDAYLWKSDMYKIADWLYELSQYEQANDIEVMNPSAQLVWAYVLYDNRNLSDDEFDQHINQFNPSEASPNFQDYDRDDYDSLGYCKRLTNRINYLDHIFQEETATKDMTRVKSWALDKLNFWMANHDNEEVLPHWLRGIDKEVALPLVNSILKLRYAWRDNKQNGIPIDTLRNARQLYSWEELLKNDDTYRPDTEYMQYASGVLGQLMGHPDLEQDLVSFIVQSHQPYTGDANYLRKVADRLGDEAVIKQATTIQKQQQERLALAKTERKNKGNDDDLHLLIGSDKYQLEESKKKTKALQERIAQKEAYKGLLAILEHANKFSEEETNGTTE